MFKVTGDAVKAELMYTRCIELDSADWTAHSNRAAVRQTPQCCCPSTLWRRVGISVVGLERSASL